MIVMKFGGTSLGDAERVNTVCELIKAEKRDPLVVVSAHSKMTNLLIGAAEEAMRGRVDEALEEVRERQMEIMQPLGLDPGLIAGNLRTLGELLRGIYLVKELTTRTKDFVMSFGERMSSKVVAAALVKHGVDAAAVNSYELGFITDSVYGIARPLDDSADNIRATCEHYAGKTVVTTGFIGKNKAGEITTIGRSGSDYSASFFGAALGAEEIQIWTDVDGVLTADPSIMPEAKPLERMTFSEASEVAYYGGEVLHPYTMRPAISHGIHIRVKNTFKPEAQGTLIVPDSDGKVDHAVKSIVYKENVILIHVESSRMLLRHGFMARLFEVLGRHGVVIDMIATSEVSVSLTTDSIEGVREAAAELKADKEMNSEVRVEEGKALICAVGKGMRHVVGLASRVFGAVATSGVSIQMISQGASEINIAFLVDNSDITGAVRALHGEFFSEEGE